MKARQRGFTLVELIVVIAILTLLIGILVPYLSGARRQAKASVCLSQLKGIGTGFMVYLNENRDQFPPFRLSFVPPGNQATNLRFVNEHGCQRPRWQWFLNTDQGPPVDPIKFQRHIQTQGFFNDDTTHPKGTLMTNKLYQCPGMDSDFTVRLETGEQTTALDDIRHGSYGYNYQYLGNARQDTDPSRWDNFSVGLHKIKATPNTVLVADSRGASLPHGLHSYTLDPPRLAREQNATRMGPDENHVLPGDDPATMRFSPVEMRHNGQGNVIFADGHGSGMKLDALGYQLDEKGVATPILDPAEGTKWHNRLWTGLGTDKFAEQRFGISQP